MARTPGSERGELRARSPGRGPSEEPLLSALQSRMAHTGSDATAVLSAYGAGISSYREGISAYGADISERLALEDLRLESESEAEGDAPLTPSRYSKGPRRLARVAVFGAVAILTSIILVWVIISLEQRGEAGMDQCLCRATQQAQEELEEARANRTRADEEMALSSNATLGPVLRVFHRQKELLTAHGSAIVALREAARARDLRLPVSRVRGHKFHVDIIEEDDPAIWHQSTFRQHANFGFVHFSSYRLSPTLVVVTGLGHLRSRGDRRIQECTWVTEGGTRYKGRLSLDTQEEHHNFLYEPMTMNCTLPKEADHHQTGGPGGGGGARLLWSSEGGHLEVKLDQEIFYPYREIDGYKIHAEDSDGPFDYETLFCGPPMFGNLNVHSLTQWISYHRYHAGIEHFILYDAGAVDDHFTEMLQPLVLEGVVRLTDFREALQYDIWAENQALAMHDCLFRSRNLARWVFFHDLDEFLQIPPPLTLPALLRKHKDQPYLTHGCLVFSVDNCEESNVWDRQHGKFAVEMLLYREKLPYCTSPHKFSRSKCLNYHGHRKMVQNPRKINRTYVHVPDIPDSGGVDLPVEHLRHAHYRSLFHIGRPCRDKPWGEAVVEKDGSIAEIAAHARACAKENFASEKCKPGMEAE